MAPWIGIDAWKSWRDTAWGSILPHPTGILGQVEDGSARRRLLWDVVTGIMGGDAGGPS